MGYILTAFGACVIGNSSQVSDGAGAVLLMKRSVAMQKGLPILGVFRFAIFWTRVFYYIQIKLG